MSKYDDIIKLPHHVSKIHPQMSIMARSAQFAPFAALSGYDEAVKEIRRKAIKGNLKLVDCPIRHLGTEMAQQIYLKIQNRLLELGVEIKFDKVAKNLIIDGNVIKGIVISDSRNKDIEEKVYGDKVVVATGRKGADWLKDMCLEHNIDHRAGTVDIGVRVELRFI